LPEPLKYLYDRGFIEHLAACVSCEVKGFDADKLIFKIKDEQWQNRELKERLRHITLCLGQTLPGDYEEQLQTVCCIADKFKDFEHSGLLGMVFPDFVEVYGFKNPDISIPALKYLTQFSSSEFAIRPFILGNATKIMNSLNLWAKDKDKHVRRLASEGCRPRLPWAMALPIFKKDPSAILPILEMLKQDESLYVRRSVANNLNDISKDNPEVVLDIAERWKGQCEETDWIVRHGLRSLLKQGNERALNLFDYRNIQPEQILFCLKNDKVMLGDCVDFDINLKFPAQIKDTSLKLRVEYMIEFAGANGRVRKKIFQLCQKNTVPAELKSQKSYAFKDLSTRKHYAGPHAINLIVNGQTIARSCFEVIA